MSFSLNPATYLELTSSTPGLVLSVRIGVRKRDRSIEIREVAVAAREARQLAKIVVAASRKVRAASRRATDASGALDREHRRRLN